MTLVETLPLLSAAGRSPIPSANESVLTDPTKIAADEISDQDSLFYGFTSTTNWEVPTLALLGDTQLKAIGSYQRTDLSHTQDFDATSLPLSAFLREEDTDTWSGELQWSSSAGENFDWQLSAFYLRLTSDGRINIPNWTHILLDGSSFFGDTIRGVQENKNESLGLALHTDWYLTDTLTMSAGIRYSRDYREIEVLRDRTEASQTGVELIGCNEAFGERSFNFVPLKLNDRGSVVEVINDQGQKAALVAAVPSCDVTYREPSGGLGLEWRPLEDHLFYARVDRGYKSGGFANFGFGGYDPEFIWAYAAGAKSTFWNERVTVNTEVFFYDYTDFQITIIDGLSLRAENAPETEMWGVDLETSFEPIDSLRFDASVGYLDAEFKEYNSIDPTDQTKFGPQESCKFVPNQPGICPVTPDDFSGNRVSRAPEWKINLAAEYTVYLGRYGSLTPRIQYYWSDETYYRAFNRPEDRQESYHLTDVKLTWTSPTQDWSVEGFVTNLEDDPIYQNVLVGPSSLENPFNAWYGPPRLWGVRVAFSY